MSYPMGWAHVRSIRWRGRMVWLAIDVANVLYDLAGFLHLPRPRQIAQPFTWYPAEVQKHGATRAEMNLREFEHVRSRLGLT